MNLEGNKSTTGIYYKSIQIENEDGMIMKVPESDGLEIKGFLLPVKEEKYITTYGIDINSVYKYLVKPHKNVNVGDYIKFGEKTYEIDLEPVRWKNHICLVLKLWQ